MAHVYPLRAGITDSVAENPYRRQRRRVRVGVIAVAPLVIASHFQRDGLRKTNPLASMTRAGN